MMNNGFPFYEMSAIFSMRQYATDVHKDPPPHGGAKIRMFVASDTENPAALHES